MSDVNPSMIEIGFLRRLQAGVPFNDAVNACGPTGLKVSFNCILNGWVEQGRITKMGEAMIAPVITIIKE